MIRPAPPSKLLRILLIRPPFISLRSGPPIGLAYLQGMLKREGHTVRVWDVNLDLQNQFQSRDYNRDFVLPADHPEVPRTYEKMDALCEQALEWEPDLIGFSLSYPTEAFGLAMAARLSQHVRCIVGGPQATHNAEALAGLGHFDAVVVGYGEEAVRRAVRERGIIEEPLQSEGNYEPDYTGVEIEHYNGLLPLITTRGCPNRCAFCTQHYPYICQPAESIAQHVAEQTAARRILYNDSNINVFPQRTEELFDALSRVPNMPTGHVFGMQVRPKHETYIAKMAAAGVDEVRIGVESGSPRERKSMVKPHFSNDLAVQFVQCLASHGIKVWAQYIFCYPDQTDDDRAATVELMNRMNDAAGADMVQHYWYKFIVHEGTDDYFRTKHNVTVDPVSRQTWHNDQYNPDRLAALHEQFTDRVPGNATIYM